MYPLRAEGPGGDGEPKPPAADHGRPESSMEAQKRSVAMSGFVLRVEISDWDPLVGTVGLFDSGGRRQV